MGEVVERIVVGLIAVMEFGQEIVEVRLYDVVLVEVLELLEDSNNQGLKKLLVD